MSPTPSPLSGRLVPLRTRDEVRASLETCTVYVVEVPAKFANSVKDALQAAVPDFRTSEISHLRRVVQFKFLPWHLQRQFYPPARLPRGSVDRITKTLLSGFSAFSSYTSLFFASSPSPAQNSSATVPGKAVTEPSDLVRYFLLCPTSRIGEVALCNVIRQTPAFEGENSPPRLFHVTVPSMSPVSLEQAELWSDEYWPIAYKNTNPYGPHPSLVQRNTEEIGPVAGHYLALAKIAGKQTSCDCLGEDLGVVVVDHTKTSPEIIAVAGDCRWRSINGVAQTHSGAGNVMAHAVQRAISMVAKKRLRAAGPAPAILEERLDSSPFSDVPLTNIETEYFKQNNISSSGYLCVDLDIYLTNEPCVMCSMAILHSRFRRCVFAKRMPRTGALTSDSPNNCDEGGLKTGLFWRPSELNWKFLAWEYEEDSEEWKAYAELEETMARTGLDRISARRYLQADLQV